LDLQEPRFADPVAAGHDEDDRAHHHRIDPEIPLPRILSFGNSPRVSITIFGSLPEMPHLAEELLVNIDLSMRVIDAILVSIREHAPLDADHGRVADVLRDPLSIAGDPSRETSLQLNKHSIRLRNRA
jgi:hypothetical protein